MSGACRCVFRQAVLLMVAFVPLALASGHGVWPTGGEEVCDASPRSADCRAAPGGAREQLDLADATSAMQKKVELRAHEQYFVEEAADAEGPIVIGVEEAADTEGHILIGVGEEEQAIEEDRKVDGLTKSYSRDFAEAAEEATEDEAPLKCHVTYLNADHNLDAPIAADLKELIDNTAAVGHPNYYPIVFFDRGAAKTRVEGLKGLNGKDDAPKYTGVRYIEKDFKTGSMKVAQELGEQDSDSLETMTRFLTWAFQRCKKKSANAKILLSLSSHGAGYGGFGGDEVGSLLEGGQATAARVSSRSRLALIRNNQIRTAIRDSKAAVVPPITGKLDLLAFDACIMMTFSTLYVLDDVAELYMASEALEPGHGWNYAAVDPSASSFGMAKKIIDAFVATPGSQTKTLAVFRTEDFAAFRAAMDALAIDMERVLKAPGGDAAARLIGRARDDTAPADASDDKLVDLGHFIKNLKGQTLEALPSLRNVIEAAEAKYAQMLHRGYAKTGKGDDKRLTGMAIWFSMYKQDLYTKEVKQWRKGEDGFKAAENRPWQKFLEAMQKFLVLDRLCNHEGNSTCVCGAGEEKKMWNYKGNDLYYCQDACKEQGKAKLAQADDSGKDVFLCSDFGKGDAVIVDGRRGAVHGRRGLVTWDYRPESKAVLIKWKDDGEVSYVEADRITYVVKEATTTITTTSPPTTSTTTSPPTTSTTTSPPTTSTPACKGDAATWIMSGYELNCQITAKNGWCTDKNAEGLSANEVCPGCKKCKPVIVGGCGSTLNGCCPGTDIAAGPNGEGCPQEELPPTDPPTEAPTEAPAPAPCRRRMCKTTTTTSCRRRMCK